MVSGRQRNRLLWSSTRGTLANLFVWRREARPNWSIEVPSTGGPELPPDGQSLVFVVPLNNQGSAVYIPELENAQGFEAAGIRWALFAALVAGWAVHRGNSADSLKLLLFDLASQKSGVKWREFSWPIRRARWPLCISTVVSTIKRATTAQVADHNWKRIVLAGVSGRRRSLRKPRFFLAPMAIHPLLARDASIQEIYALDWETH